MRNIPVVFIGGSLDGVNTKISEHLLSRYSVAVMPATETFMSTESGLTTIPLGKIENYHASEFCTVSRKPYILMLLNDMTSDEAFIRILDNYCNSKETNNAKEK